MPIKNPQLEKEWLRKLQPLCGRTIRGLRYLTAGECADLMLSHAPLVMELDDGTLLWPMADDEGNDGGALFIQPSVSARQRGLPDGAPAL